MTTPLGAASSRRITPGDLLARLGGAELGVLARVRTSRDRFIQMGIVLLSTSGLATASMAFALHDGVQLPWLVSVTAGLVWGFIVLNLDRLLILNLDVRGSGWGRAFAMVGPRIVLAALIGIVVSTPLVLRIFQEDIQAAVSVSSVERSAEFAKQSQNSAEAIALKHVNDQIANDEAILRGDIKGIVTPNLAAAKDRVGQAETTLERRRAASDSLYQQMVCERYGRDCRGASGKHGDGPLYRALKKQSDVALAQTKQAAKELSDAQAAETRIREGALKDNDKTVAAAQAQANKELPDLRKQQATLQASVDKQRNRGTDDIAGAQGLLSQLSGLEELGRQNSAAWWAHRLVALLFFMVELLPVLVKVLTSLATPTPYDRMKELEDDSLVDQAKTNRNDERRRIEVTSRKNREIEEDMLQRERDLGVRANAHVASRMEEILDQALLDWSREVTRTLASAVPPASGAGPVAGDGTGHANGTSHGPASPRQVTLPDTAAARKSAADAQAQEAIRRSFNLPGSGNQP